jgi:hypothetical protein
MATWNLQQKPVVAREGVLRNAVSLQQIIGGAPTKYKNLGYYNGTPPSIAPPGWYEWESSGAPSATQPDGLTVHGVSSWAEG